MNILYISSHDIVGQQFNGYLLHKALREKGHTTNMLVALKASNEEGIHKAGNTLLNRIDRRIDLVEKRLGLYSLLPLSSSTLYFNQYYRSAEIIHLQLLHAFPFFSLLNIPIISRRRPVLWTMHDPWLLSGHCVHPLDCDRWLTGCGNCPDITLPLAVKRDATAFMWKVKDWIMRHSALTLVVTSRWMQKKVSRSPIVSHLPSRLIPFGVDRTIFRPKNKASCRSRFGIPPEAHVIIFRNAPHYIYKGTDYVKKALDLYTPHKPTYLLTIDAPYGFHSSYGLDALRNKYRIIDLDWVNDRDLIVDALNAADIFLMPSIAETFGMMAVESMACGTPVIVFEGTSLPDVIRAPQGGIAVPYMDYRALASIIGDLLNDPNRLRALTEGALQLVKEEYPIELYVKRHIELYESLITERKTS
jgi:glycosyltransferase involved in cell wall biosynthesis